MYLIEVRESGILPSGLETILAQVTNPVQDKTTYSIVFKFSEEAFMWDSVECIAEAKDDDFYIFALLHLLRLMYLNLMVIMTHHYSNEEVSWY